MKTKAFINKILCVAAALVLSLFCVFESVFTKPVKVRADEVVYTDVLADLQKDSSFNVEDYPAKADDTSLQVIQIAESVNGELFIYVYQPCHDTLDLRAAGVSMYNGYSENGRDFSPLRYDLTLLSSNGVFEKYLVNDYVVTADSERWYNIVTLYRRADKSIDKDIVGGTTDLIGIPVGQQWRFYYYNDELMVEHGTFKTLYVDIITADNIIFNNGLTMGNLAGLYNYGNAHFVSFNVEEYVIKRIYDADVTYKSRDITLYYGAFRPDDYYGDYEQHTVTLRENDTASFNGTGWLGQTVEWNRISKSSDFIANLEKQKVDVSVCKEAVLSSQWTFAFCETPKSITAVTGMTIDSYTEISEVAVLRLHFLDDRDREYNLGVVSNVVTEDDIPGGSFVPIEVAIDELWSDVLEFFSDMLGWVIGIALLVLGVIAVAIFAPWIFSLIGKGFLAACKFALSILRVVLKWGWKIIVFIICFPWNFIFKLFKKKNKNRP